MTRFVVLLHRDEMGRRRDCFLVADLRAKEVVAVAPWEQMATTVAGMMEAEA